jgi:hypothetical protein
VGGVDACQGFGAGVVAVVVGEQDEIRAQVALVEGRGGVDEVTRGAVMGKVGIDHQDNAGGVLEGKRVLAEPVDSNVAVGDV